MILINDNWEPVNNIDDIIKVCREYISDEFVKKMKEIIKRETVEVFFDED